MIRECSGSPTPILNGTEYIESLHGAGVRVDDLPIVQPVVQHQIWQRMTPGDRPDRLTDVIARLQREDDRFQVEGGSWTNNISWVRGYDRVLIPWIGPAPISTSDSSRQAWAPTTRGIATVCFTYSRPKPVATGILGLESHTSLIAGGLTDHDGEQAATHLFTDTPPPQ